MNFSKKNNLRINSSVLILIILAICISINFIADKLFLRWDLTADQRYSISDITKDLVANLDNTVNITLYFSKDLPANLQIYINHIEDLLNEYQSYSKGRILIRRIDPLDNADDLKRVQKLGISTLPMQLIANDKMEFRDIYLGMEVNYGTNTEVLPNVGGLFSIEYELTRILKKVLSVEIPTIGLAISSEKQNDFSFLIETLSKDYQIRLIDLTLEEDLGDLDLLIIVDSQTPLSEKAKYYVDQFIMRDKDILYFGDPFIIQNNLQVETKISGLDQLWKHYGADLKSEMIFDNQYHGQLTYIQGRYQRISPYPLFINLVRENFDLNNPIFAYLQNIEVNWASYWDILDDTKVEVLASTGKEGGITPSLFLNPDQYFQQYGYKPNLPVIIKVEGLLTSYYGKIPETETSTGSESTLSLEVTKKEDFPDLLKQNNGNSRLILSSDNDMLSDQTVSANRSNIAFVLNCIDYLTVGTGLNEIRAKTLTEFPLRGINKLTKNQKYLIKYLIIFLIPILLSIKLIIFKYLRNNRKKNYLLSLKK